MADAGQNPAGEEHVVELDVELAQRERDVRLQPVDEHHSHRSRLRRGVAGALERFERRLGPERVGVALERLADRELAEPGADAGELPGVELVVRLAHQPSERDLELDRIIVH